MQQILYTSALSELLPTLLAEAPVPDCIAVLTDQTTHRHCRSLLGNSAATAYDIVIPPTDTHKTLDTLAQVWEGLQRAEATRHSLLINLGGGMVTDLGGFAAATFKRGIRFINIPTTLLAMVDAAVGGKTGINFGGLKNEVGCFADAQTVVVCTELLRTLDDENLRSGYAEMLKHALLTGTDCWARHLRFDLSAPDFDILQGLVRESIVCKQHIVEQDPHEKGIRKALNLGHTVGHALESFFIETQRPILHGYAVAWGLVCELFMSAAQAGLPTDVLHTTTRFILHTYGRPAITCNDYDRLHALMLHDKKNVAGSIRFTLLSDVGEILIDQTADRTLIEDALDFLREA